MNEKNGGNSHCKYGIRKFERKFPYVVSVDIDDAFFVIFMS